MKPPPNFPKKAALAALAASLIALALLPGCGKPAKPAARAPAKPAPNPEAAAAAAGARTNLAVEFVSAFDNSLPPGNKGRDPFNPLSQSRIPAPLKVPVSGSNAAPSDPQLKLRGVVGSPGHWLASINNQILAVPDEVSVRVPGGAVRLKVIEIGSNYADVLIEGTATKRLTIGQEK
jgi:hypothetical protein